MVELDFRNAEEDDSGEIVRLLNSHLFGGNFLLEVVGDKNPDTNLQALVEAADTEYGYEQTTIAYRDHDPVGLFIGYPRELLRALGPRTLSILMRARSPLAWPGMIRAQARLARVEPPFLHSSYVLRCICATDRALVPAIVAEAVAEAAEEECETIVVNVYEEDGELERILRGEGFEEGDRRPITENKLAQRLGTAHSLQLRRATGYLAESPDSELPA